MMNQRRARMKRRQRQRYIGGQTVPAHNPISERMAGGVGQVADAWNMEKAENAVAA